MNKQTKKFLLLFLAAWVIAFLVIAMTVLNQKKYSKKIEGSWYIQQGNDCIILTFDCKKGKYTVKSEQKNETLSIGTFDSKKNVVQMSNENNPNVIEYMYLLEDSDRFILEYRDSYFPVRFTREKKAQPISMPDKNPESNSQQDMTFEEMETCFRSIKLLLTSTEWLKEDGSIIVFDFETISYGNLLSYSYEITQAIAKENEYCFSMELKNNTNYECNLKNNEPGNMLKNWTLTMKPEEGELIIARNRTELNPSSNRN